MTKEELIKKIQNAFKDVKLEDGIGLWEGQGVDEYADNKKMVELRNKDERNDWNNILYKDMVLCESSLSFFDAKGMRFCLPKFLMFDLLSDEIFEKENINAPDVLFTLGYKLNHEYQKKRFSLFNKEQIQCIISYLEYILDEVVERYKEYSNQYGSAPEALYSDYDYVEINRIIAEWKKSLTFICK